MKAINKSIDKLDAKEKISGQAKYINDYDMDDMLYAKTVRSSVAHGNILSINKPPLPKGYYLVDYTDIPGKNIVKMIFDDWPVFAEKTVNYIGEPIMLVVGKDKQVIDEIISRINIDYDILEPVFDHRNNVIDYHFDKGNPNDVFASDKKVISYSYQTGYQEQAYIEPQGFIGYKENDKTTLVGSIQAPYYVKNAVLETLAAKEENVRVIQATVGGAFGGKEEFPSMMACQLAVAVHKIQKPIKLIYEREEDMLVTTKRHPSTTTLKAVINKDNTIAGLSANVAIDGGAYIGLSGVVLSRALIAVSSAYTIPNLDVNGFVYVTHTVPNGAFRGFGAPQMIFAIEMFMQHIADELGIDAYTFRRNHLAKQGDKTSTNGLFRDPVIMPKMIDKACAISNYHEKAKAYQKEDCYKGIGMSWFLHGCGFTGSGESTHINAKVKLEKDTQDHVYLKIAAVDMGQGAKTTLTKVVANVLELPIERVHFPLPDTDEVPDSGPTVASRTAMIVGGLCARAANQLKASWVNGEEQTVYENYKQPDYVKWNEDTFQGDAYPAYSWGVNICEVEVNPITYEVDVKHIWSVYDIGASLDDRIVLGQADGGIAQGVSYGYLEVMRHHEGKILQKNMTDYIIPTSVDMPPTETHFMDNPYALGPYGAKGVGELSLVGGAPALALAVQMAIQKPVNQIPITPEVIMELMQNEN